MMTAIPLETTYLKFTRAVIHPFNKSCWCLGIAGRKGMVPIYMEHCVLIKQKLNTKSHSSSSISTNIKYECPMNVFDIEGMLCFLKEQWEAIDYGQGLP